MDFFKKLLFKRDLGLSVEETLPFWTIFILILSFDITLTVLFAELIVRGHRKTHKKPDFKHQSAKCSPKTDFNASYKIGWAHKIGLPLRTQSPDA